MSWKRMKRAILETREFDGREVPHVIGWMDERHCGCYFVEGMRLDKNEMTAGAGACDEHEKEVAETMRKYKETPGQEIEAHEFWIELLENEIRTSR